MKKMLKVNMLRLLLGMSTLVFLGISGSFTAYAGDTPAAPQQHKRATFSHSVTYGIPLYSDQRLQVIDKGHC